MAAQIRPGVTVSILANPVSSSLQIDTGTWFIIGTSDQGPANTPVILYSLNDFITWFGARASYSVLYDAVETFFQEGGAQCYVSRIVGPNATTGTKNLLDGGAGVSLIVNAIGPGSYSGAIKVGVAAGSGSNYQIVVTDGSGTVLEQSYDLADQQSAIGWSKYSQYVRIVLGATSNNPAVLSPAVLSTGNDQRGNITDAERQAAIDSFTSGFGPGQISYPGNTTNTMYSALATHASTHNRAAILDLPDSATKATVKAAAATLSSRYAAAFTGWCIIPGVTAGTTRTVPPSALVAGLLGRNDPVFGVNSGSVRD
jgi:phage tail sheath protein FI